MGFCPVCKSEYKEGITVCHDCKVPLVENLSKGSSSIMHVGEEERNALQSMADAAGIDPKDLTPEKIGEIREKAKKEAEEAWDKDTYVDKRVKAGEYKSSGIVLLGTGIFGIAALVLLYLGIIPSLSSIRNNPLFMGVMSVLFVLFVVIGFITCSKVPDILSAAEKDEALIEEIRKMMKESLTKEVIDKKAFPEQDISAMPDMDLYYGREEYMQTALKEAFPDADSALLEMMLDERYNQLYEDNDH